MDTEKLKLPFYFKPGDSPLNSGYPVKLPFEYYFDEELNLLKQKSSNETSVLLREVYQLGSLLEGSLSNSSGRSYFTPFINFIKKNSEINHSVLEIGAGQGVLLKELKEYFSYAIGIDPQEQKQNEIEVICDFFPSKLIKNNFDTIVHYGVLEHIENPIQFLEDHKVHLKKNGNVIIAVPNCSDYIEEGEISMFIHEHFNYFEDSSLVRVLKKVGFNEFNIEKFQGVIFISARWDGSDSVNFENLESNSSVEFSKKVIEKIDILRNKIEGFKDGDIAVYPAQRGLNYLSILEKTNVRLVDDSLEIIGRYLPGFSNKIESFNSLIESPPKLILLTSKTFKQQLLKKMSSLEKLSNCQIEVL
jgi:SAM-dependent methyltransferase